MRSVRVYHTHYGCETGCCGHVIEIDGKEVGGFCFDHPYGQNHLEFAKRIVEEELGGDHCRDLDWEHAEIETIED